MKLYEEIREHRKKMGICPSAEDGANVPVLIREFCNKDFYKDDYQSITSYFSDDFVAYEDTMDLMRKLADLLE
jgi:hypothetical protein